MSPSRAVANPNDELRAAVTQPGAGVGAGVALAVLSQDGPVLDALDTAVTSDHGIHIATTEEALAEFIVSAHCGVAVLDADFCADADQLATRLRSQFPDLVLIVAGRDSQQAALAASITAGVIYRFLHKPVSTQRVRQFVAAALRRHDEEHAESAAVASAPAIAIHRPKKPQVNSTWAALGALALLALAGIVYFASGSHNSTRTVQPTAAEVGKPVTSIPAADAQLNKLLGDAEQALVQNRLAYAAVLIEAARTLQPDNVRVAFLTGQLAKERERTVLARARSAAANGDIKQALAVLDGSNAATPGSTTVAETRRDLERQQIDERVRGLIKLAGERMSNGAITTSQANSALAALDAARGLSPRDPAVARLEQSINTSILSEARAAATRGDGSSAVNWLQMASERRLRRSDIDAVRSMLTAAQGNARSKELARLSANANDLIARSRADDSAVESARASLTTLRSYEGNGPNTLEAQDRFGNVLLTRSRSALDAGRLDDAQKLLSEAQSLGAAADAVTSLGTAIASQRDRVRKANAVVAASELTRIKTFTPLYPNAAASKGVVGWVEVEFTVATDGSVTEPRIVAAEPEGVFDQAALDSVLRWRYAPVIRDGKPVAQRARQRIRFALE